MRTGTAGGRGVRPIRESGHVDEGDSVCETQIRTVSRDVYTPVAGELAETVVGEDGAVADGDTLAWMVPDAR